MLMWIIELPRFFWLTFCSSFSQAVKLDEVNDDGVPYVGSDPISEVFCGCNCKRYQITLSRVGVFDYK